MLPWPSGYLGQEQARAPAPDPLLPSKLITHRLPPPNPTTAPLTGPGARRLLRPPRTSPWPPAGPRCQQDGPRPARAPRTLLFTSMVPPQPPPAPCRWLRFMLRPSPAAASGSRAAPQERGERVRGRRALDVAAAGSLLTGTCRGAAAARVSAQSSAGRLLTRRDRGWDWPRGQRGRDSLPQGLGGTGDGGGGGWWGERGGAEATGSAASRSAASPASPRARTRTGREARRARSPAASLKARAPPTPNRKRAPASAAPTNRYTSFKARGRATF